VKPTRVSEHKDNNISVASEGAKLITRRRLISGLLGFTAGLFSSRAVQAQTETEDSGVSELRFPGDPTEHNVVFQFNKPEDSYHQAVLFAVGELLRKYGDNITIVVTAFGPGIHILAKNPTRPVSGNVKQKVKSLAQYGVKFHACGNTMDSLKWTKDDMLDFAEIVQIGADDIMTLQEQGYSYLSW
jgi:intracellular sulfur oxidation DsrE/DsrF family protein